MNENKLSIGSLFSGIGGLELGLERAGMEVRWQVEVDEFCRRVLARHWPDVTRYGDINEIDWSEVEDVELICGGFPCQPVSHAGQRRAQRDERWLWPAFADAVRVLRPRYVLVENVPGLLTAARGGAMGDVLGDLAACGYDAEWDCIPAAAVGAPHLRDRVWIVAHRQGDPQRPHSDRLRSHRTAAYEDGQGGGVQPGDEQVRVPRSVGQGASAPMADAYGSVGRSTGGSGQEVFRPEAVERPGRCSSRERGPWAVEPDVGRVAYGVSDRVDRLRALGNAVVPQVSEWVGRQIIERELQQAAKAA